jgi:hypothetical protein
MEARKPSVEVVRKPHDHESDRHATRLRRTTLLLIEKRRVGVTAQLRRLSLPRKRYADLCLAAALCRSERRCLAGVEEPESTANRCLSANVDAQLAELEESLARVERWLPSTARVAAEAEAKSRFVEIAERIRHELGSEGLLPELIAPEQEVIAPEPEPDSPALAPARCTATTRKGARCKNSVSEGDLCAVHVAARARAEAAAAEPESTPEGRAETEEPGVRRPRFDHPRVARVAWPLAGTAATAAATALIWSGLSAGGHGSVGPGVTIDPGTDREPLPMTYSSFGDARKDVRDDGATARRHGSRSSGAGEGGRSGRGDRSGHGDPATVLTRADAPAVAKGGDRAEGSSSAPPAAPSPSPEPAPEPSPEPSPAPDPAPDPAPSPAPDGGTDAPPESPEPSPLGGVGEVVEDVVDQLPLANELNKNLPAL